jgi:hypothetical protein
VLICKKEVTGKAKNDGRNHINNLAQKAEAMGKQESK